MKEPEYRDCRRDFPTGFEKNQSGPSDAGSTASTRACSHFRSSMPDILNSLSLGEAADEAFKRIFSFAGRDMGIDRWLVTVLDGERRTVDPLVWYDVDDVDPMIPRWSERDPGVADRVRRWFTRSKEGEVQSWHLPTEVRDARREMIEVFQKAGIKSGVSVPLSSKGPLTPTLSVFTTRAYRLWPDDSIPFFRFFGESVMAMLRCEYPPEKLRNASPLKRIAQERGSIQRPLTYLVGQSEALQTLLTKIQQVARTKATVLLLGETGVGKGVFARAIHDVSPRSDRPFVQVNCAALAPSLIESELFGHERGAFTGAVSRRLGRFEIADGSTLFLDEIGDLPLALQSKLLRVLDDGEFERIGTSKTVRTDVRVIAATNRNLAKDVEMGRFRRDLWYRLNVFPISIPPLRERPDDIGPLVRHFVQRYEKKVGKTFDPIPARVIGALSRHSWPGNVRELENLIERAAIIAVDGRFSIEGPDLSAVQPPLSDRTLEDVEREHILATLKSAQWKIQGPQGAARRLGVNASTLRSRMKKLHILRPEPLDKAQPSDGAASPWDLPLPVSE